MAPNPVCDVIVFLHGAVVFNPVGSVRQECDVALDVAKVRQYAVKCRAVRPCPALAQPRYAPYKWRVKNGALVRRNVN
jgi:hypothetical protein